MLLSTNRKRGTDSLLDSIDNYKLTLGSMCALAHVLEKRYSAESRIAPKMHTSHHSKTGAASPVTPDMLSQGQDIDLIVEVKRSLPSSDGGRNAVLAQITRYDSDLTGWKRIPRTHDIMLMTHMSKSSEWADFLDESLKQKKASFARKVSVVEYVRDSERVTYFILKNAWGETSNATLNAHLHKGVVVKGEEAVRKMGVIQFSDSKPDIVYTISILWGHIFPALITKDEHVSTRGRQAIDLKVDLTAIMSKTRKSLGSFFYPPRQPWIAEALDMLVKMKMAERHPDGQFLVHYKSVRGDIICFFAKKLTKINMLHDQRKSGDVRDYF